MAGAPLNAPERLPDRLVLGIDIGGTGLKIGLVDLSGDPAILAVEILHGHATTDPFESLDRLHQSALHLLRNHGLEPEDLKAIGVGCAGLVDVAAGLLRTSPNLPTWRMVPLRAGLEQRFGRTVRLVNDAAAFLEAEWRHGAARGARNAIFLTLGTGVGGGLVLDGRPFRGGSGLGAEIGHMSIDGEGPLCPCGNRGCLEMYVGRAAVEREARALGLPEGESSPAAVSARAAAGDTAAEAVFDRIGRRLGGALAGLVNLLEPEVIVIGGGIGGAAAWLLPGAREVLEERSMVARQRPVRLESARFGPGAGLIGAALLAIPES